MDFKLVKFSVMTNSDNIINYSNDPCYACAQTTKRNSIASFFFQQCVKIAHTKSWKPPTHVIIIETTISEQSNMKNRQGKFSF